jgi:hypothetical protein
MTRRFAPRALLGLLAAAAAARAESSAPAPGSSSQSTQEFDVVDAPPEWRARNAPGTRCDAVPYWNDVRALSRHVPLGERNLLPA